VKRKYHLPNKIIWQGETSGEAQRRIQQVIFAKIKEAVQRAGLPGEEGVDEPGRWEEPREPFSTDRYQVGRSTYRLPSYDEGGQPVDVTVKPKSTTTEETPPVQIWTDETIGAHIRATFGEYGPRGQTYYGVQTPGGLMMVTAVAGGRPIFSRFLFGGVRRDTEGHWLSTGEEVVYPIGRYAFRVTGPSEAGAPHPYVAVVEDLQGKIYKEKVWTKHSPGYKLVFDVPQAPRLGGLGGLGGTSTGPGAGAGGEGGGFNPPGTGGILPGRGALIGWQCHPGWYPDPLVDPYYAGMSDDDLWRLFINLCNARAIRNLDLSEEYIRREMIPRYTGPLGATNTLSDFSRHSIEHFQERLRLLRSLMFAFNRLDREIEKLNVELTPLIFSQHRTSSQFTRPFGFGARMSGQAYWPTQHEPAPQHRERVNELRAQLQEKGDAFKVVLQGIIKLLEEDPFLTYFVEGLKAEKHIDVPDETEISAKLADVKDLAQIQQEILKQLDKILASLAKARHSLCSKPERILDVPLVYEGVLASLEGINLRFDHVARERIVGHQKQEAWIDIGLSAVGIVLFVGGLIVSLAGGPAGVTAFIAVAGTVVGGVQAMRSIDKAAFTTTLSSASVHYGRGLVTLEAARDARFWATVDSVLFAADAAFSALDIIKAGRPALQARQATATARLTSAGQEFERTTEAASRLDFQTLMERAAPRGQLPIDPAELQAFGVVPTQKNVVGQIAEELVERAVLPSGEYLPLASKLNSNQGIDFVFVRRRVFENIFGPVATSQDASRLLVQASDEQFRRLSQSLAGTRQSDDLVTVEVKFARAATPLEEVLKSSRKGVQLNQTWFSDPQKGVILAMKGFTKNPEVQATGRLLEEVIGPSAQFIERLTRVGIRVSPTGTYEFTRLTEQIINDAAASRAIYQSPRYWGSSVEGLLRAERAGDQVKATRFRNMLQQMNRQIDALDEAVRRAKQAQEASRQAVRALERAEPALREIPELIVKPQTPGITQALHVATSTARAYLAAARQRLAEAEADLDAARPLIQAAESQRQQIDRQVGVEMSDLDRLSPGRIEPATADLDRLRREYPQLFAP
jgi:exonuclease VII small subunit